jgi:hypothetical protein
MQNLGTLRQLFLGNLADDRREEREIMPSLMATLLRWRTHSARTKSLILPCLKMQNAEDSLCSLLVASYSVYDADIIIHPGQYICRYKSGRGNQRIEIMIRTQAISANLRLGSLTVLGADRHCLVLSHCQIKFGD